MVTVNYQMFGTKGFQLRLRLYQDGETKFINVTRKLKGNIQRKHWNPKKQQFIPSCPFADENNEMLVTFRQKYDIASSEWSGSVYGMIANMEEESLPGGTGMKLKDFMTQVIDEQKSKTHADGTVKGSYEGYVKLDKRLDEFCKFKKIAYEKLYVSDVNPVFVNSIFDWIVNNRKGKGHVYISSMLHAVIVRADKEGLLKFKDFENCKWKKKKNGSAQKYDTLTSEQCKKFVELKPSELPKNPKSLLYHDFCKFILYTGQSACDAISLKYSDIKNIGGVDHFIFNRRKISEKQAVPCTVPINDVMRSIMNRWKHQAKDGYIFPIRNDSKLKTQTTNNGDIKHFISRLNLWLKKIGVILNCKFSLHSYTFRHTAITHYISKNVPIIYVANLMGTSVKNCENIYYNNQGDTVSRDKVLNAISF